MKALNLLTTFGVVASALAFGTAPAGAKDDAGVIGLSPLEPMIAEQDDSHPIAMRGVVQGLQRGAIVAELMPTQDELSTETDFPEILVGAARTDGSGRFTLRLAPDVKAQVAAGDVAIHAYDSLGRYAGIASVSADSSADPDATVEVTETGAMVVDLNMAKSVDGLTDTQRETASAEALAPTASSSELSQTGAAAGRCGLSPCPDPVYRWRTYRTWTPDVQVAVASNRTTLGRVGVKFTSRATSHVGWGIAVGGSWVSASGTYKRSNSKALSAGWEKANRTGHYAYDAPMDYASQERACVLYCDSYESRQPAFRIVPVKFVGGTQTPRKSEWVKTWTAYCTPLSNGGFFDLTTSDATTFSQGVKMAVYGHGINFQSQTGYDNEVQVNLDRPYVSGYDNRFPHKVCGKQGKPSDHPGWIQIEFGRA